MAKRVIELETKIAEKHWDIVKVRDAVKRYNLFTRKKLLKQFPAAIHWLKGMKMAPGQKHENRSKKLSSGSQILHRVRRAPRFGIHKILAHLDEATPVVFPCALFVQRIC